MTEISAWGDIGLTGLMPRAGCGGMGGVADHSRARLARLAGRPNRGR